MFKAILVLSLSFFMQSDASQSFFDFDAVDIKGNRLSFNEFKGKVVLVVNVASECGFTDNHYKGLVRLQSMYEPTGKFTVLGFPCNQFGAQEPKSEAEILKFAKAYYKVNFPLFSKINVLMENVPDYFSFLIDKSGNAPTWNFWKYLVNTNGQVIGSWGPQVDVEGIFNDVRTAVLAAVEHGKRVEDVTTEQGNVDDQVEQAKKVHQSEHEDL